MEIKSSENFLADNLFCVAKFNNFFQIANLKVDPDSFFQISVSGFGKLHKLLPRAFGSVLGIILQLELVKCEIADLIFSSFIIVVFSWVWSMLIRKKRDFNFEGVERLTDIL